MDTQITEGFVKDFQTEVHETYLRQGSKLRKTVRTRDNVVGATTTFQQITSTLSADPVECVLSDWYAGEWIEKLDEIKQEHSERRVAVNAGAWALGRKTDEQIITALDSTTNSIAAGGTGLTKAKVYEAFQTLGNGDVFEEGKMFALVGYQQWTNLLDLQEFASADYIGKDQLPFLTDGTEAKRWMGTVWMTHSGLPLASGARKVFWYRDDAVGHAAGSQVVTDITWHQSRAAFFVNNMMAQGACLIDVACVVEINCIEH